MSKKEFTVPVYAYVEVRAQLRGQITILAKDEKEAMKIASGINGLNFKELPKQCELDSQKLEWDDDTGSFQEYIDHEKSKNSLINIRINDDDLDSMEEIKVLKE